MHLELWSVRLEMQLASIDWEASFESQVSSIFNKVVVGISEEQCNVIKTIKQDLEKVIHTVCPGAVLTIYGSANCGLCLVSSDVDFSVNIKYTENVFNMVLAAIKENKTFKRPHSLFNTLSIIRSSHTPSDTEIDLTFDNKVTIATTELLAHIMNSDPRVQPLTLLIKIWCKIHCLMSPKCLESISLYMLIIFYLQQQGIVPSVCQMIDKTNPRYINGFNMAIDKRNINVPQGNKNLLQLLGDFFIFYKKVNWKNFVVCPFTALLIPKNDFNERSKDKLPVEYEDYKKQKSNLGNGRIIIQHALIHSRNCSDNMETAEFQYFREKIQEAADIYTKNSNQTFLKKILISPEHPENSALINGGGLKWSVSGYSASTTREELFKLFSKYGKVNVENMGRGIAILKFKDKLGVQRLMADNCIQLQGQQLQVKYFRHGVGANGNQRFARSNERNTIINPSEIDLTGDFDNQLKSLLSAVMLTPQEIHNINQVYSDIENVLQPQWPGCKVTPFGSITTGLGIKSSDADCYISGPCCIDQPKTAVNRAQKILNQRKDLFVELLAITRCRTPIVKLFHLPTKTNCDISFKKLGTQSSKLVAFLLQSDAKLIPISVLIKYWAKIHGLTGTDRMSNYALTMLVIFYFQQSPLNILPAVHCLQNNIQCQMVDGWITSFAEILLPQDDKQKLTIPQLLAGFFHFYAEFDFNKYIVCPYLGRPIEKELFNKPDSLPEEFAIYKNNIGNKTSLPLKTSSAMCVQDPFELNRNAASSVSDSLAAEIKEFVKFAGEMYDQNDSSDFLKNILLKIPNLEELIKVQIKKTSKELILTEVLQVTLNSDWYLCLPFIFKNFLTMALQIFDYKDEDDMVSITYVSNINRECWVRCQRGRLSKATELGSKKLIKMINAKFVQIGENEISLPVFIKIHANKRTKQCTVLFTLGDHANDHEGIFNDFTAFVTVQIPIWFRFLHNNADYKKAVTLNGYEAIQDITINTEYVCAVKNNAESDKQNKLIKPDNTYHYKQRKAKKQSSKVNEINSEKVHQIINQDDNYNILSSLIRDLGLKVNQDKLKEIQNSYYKEKKTKGQSHSVNGINSKNVQQNEINPEKVQQNKLKNTNNKKNITKKQSNSVDELNPEKVQENKMKKSQNNDYKKKKTKKQKNSVIEIKFLKVQQEIIGPNWHNVARLILDCIFNELLNLDLKKIYTDETDTLVSDIYNTVINRDVWHRCQHSLLSRSTKLGLLKQINRINNKLLQIGDRDISLPITVKIDLQKDSKLCSKVTLTLNSVKDVNAIFKDFNPFATQLFPIWFRNLVHLYNTNNFNDIEYRKEVTLNGYEVDFEKENTVQNPNKNMNITEINRDSVNNNDNVSKVSSLCGNETNMIHSQTSEVNSNTSFTKENHIVVSDNILNGKNDNQVTIKIENCSPVYIEKVLRCTTITLDLKDSNSVTNLHVNKSIITIINFVFSELLLTERYRIRGKEEDGTRTRYHLDTVVNKHSWKRCQEHRLVRAMKLSDRKQEKEIVSSIAQVGERDINIRLDITVDIIYSTDQCRVVINMYYATEHEDRFREFTEFANDIMPEWFSKLLSYCCNLPDTNETSSEDVYLKAIYKIYVEPSLIKLNEE